MKTVFYMLFFCSFLSCAVIKNEAINNQNETLELRQKELKSGIYNFIEHYIDDYDTIPYIGVHYTEGGVLEKSNYSWHKNLIFNSKELIETGDDGLVGYRRFSIKSFQYKDSADCDKAYKNWLNVHKIENGKITFKEEPETYTPEPTLVIKTKDQLILLMSFCYVDSSFWIETENYLMNQIKNIESTSAFGCDSVFVVIRY